jgi:perosamine synthetase
MSTTFEPGARAPEGFIPLSVPEIRGNEWKYIKECLDTGWVSSGGSFVDRFERELAQHVGANYAVAAVNGTAALHIALLIAGVEPDDEVLIPALTFIAPANAIRYAGAWPVFIDVEPDYWQMDPQKVAEFLDLECRWINRELRNKATGRRVKAILPVDILGHPVNADDIMRAARKYELVVVEDATESLGAKYKDRSVGCLADVGCFSFNGNKIITTGGGGMIVTDNEAWAARARHLTTQAKQDPVEYVHDEIGYNYRLGNIQAAMGCAQLENLESFICAKRKIANAYQEALRNIAGIIPMGEAPWAYSIHWMYTVLVDESSYGLSSRGLLKWLEKEKIQTRPLWQPLHQSKVYSSSQAYKVGIADFLHKHALSLPCSAGLSNSELKRVVEAVQAAPESKT